MSTLRSFALAGALAFTLAACAQTQATPDSQDHSAHHQPGAASAAATPAERMTMMDAHMKAMREMHEKMSRTRTPEERSALMAEHMKLMQEGMGMMGGMGARPMAGMGGMRAMGPTGAASAPMDMATRHQMMEKRMDMMQSMMQMMMDRMGASAAKP
jgi:Fic family protein